MEDRNEDNWNKEKKNSSINIDILRRTSRQIWCASYYIRYYIFEWQCRKIRFSDFGKKIHVGDSVDDVPRSNSAA